MTVFNMLCILHPRMYLPHFPVYMRHSKLLLYSRVEWLQPTHYQHGNNTQYSRSTWYMVMEVWHFFYLTIHDTIKDWHVIKVQQKPWQNLLFFTANNQGKGTLQNTNWMVYHKHQGNSDYTARKTIRHLLWHLITHTDEQRFQAISYSDVSKHACGQR